MKAAPLSRVILAVEGPSDERRLRLLLELPPYSDKSIDVEIIKIKTIPELVRQLGLPRYTPQVASSHGDGGTLRKLYQVLKKRGQAVEGTLLVWARDTDTQPERRQDAERARESLPPRPVPILLAIATECGEAWVIAGHQPSDPQTKAERDLRTRLGFDPWRKPEMLSHKEGSPKSAKGVLAQLFEGDEEEEDAALMRAWTSPRPEIIACGLAAFREEVLRFLPHAPGA